MQTQNGKTKTEPESMTAEEIETCFVIVKFYLSINHEESDAAWGGVFTSIELSKIEGVKESPEMIEARLEYLKTRYGLIKNSSKLGVWSVTKKFANMIAEAIQRSAEEASWKKRMKKMAKIIHDPNVNLDPKGLRDIKDLAMVY